MSRKYFVSLFVLLSTTSNQAAEKFLDVETFRKAKQAVMETLHSQAHHQVPEYKQEAEALMGKMELIIQKSQVPNQTRASIVAPQPISQIKPHMSWKEKWDVLRSTPNGKEIELAFRYLTAAKGDLLSYTTGERSAYVRGFSWMVRTLNGETDVGKSKEEIVEHIEKALRDPSVQNWDLKETVLEPTILLKNSLGITNEDIEQIPELAEDLNRLIRFSKDKQDSEAVKIKDKITKNFNNYKSNQKYG